MHGAQAAGHNPPARLLQVGGADGGNGKDQSRGQGQDAKGGVADV